MDSCKILWICKVDKDELKIIIKRNQDNNGNKKKAR